MTNGVVIITYPGSPKYSGGTVNYNGNQTMHTFTASDTLEPTVKWQSWYAWYPKKVNGKWYWRQWIYRRLLNTYVDYDNWKRWEYGDAFDYIKSL